MKRDLSCPTCGTPNAFTARDRSRGYVKLETQEALNKKNALDGNASESMHDMPSKNRRDDPKQDRIEHLEFRLRELLNAAESFIAWIDSGSHAFPDANKLDAAVALTRAALKMVTK